ncbi:MAG: Gfo/Idh/MocA family oxidoreductase, partial [Anaerolineales bacterium]|nr:Gfo/Idh/MocA family oxidoreductase [Anaerolineales bacterium]
MKFLIAGFGSIGRRHFRNLVKLGQRDIIFYRTHQSTIPDEELKGYPIESDLKAALSHHPDAVIVTNPTASHLDVAIPAAEMGCHLLIEKPLSHSLERVDKLERIIRRGSAQVLVGFQFRYHPGLLQIRDWIQQAVIGDVYFVRAHWGEYLPDWHPWED